MKCPGQDMQYWQEDAIFEANCPECNSPVEFYKDDTTRKCNKCGHRFVNPKMDFGCAAYCQFAEQCLGTLPEEFVMQQDNLLKDKVAVEMKRYFKTDFKRIGFSTKLAANAEKLAKNTEDSDLAVILCSSYLLYVGFPNAAKNNKNPTLAEIRSESIPIATDILKKLGANEQLLEEVLVVISGEGNDDGQIHSLNIVMDALSLTKLENEIKAGVSFNTISDTSLTFLSEFSRNEAEKLIQQ